MFTRKRKLEVVSDTHVNCVVEDFQVGGVNDVSETIPGNSTNLQLAAAFPATLTCLSILATGGNLTLKTNSSTVPDDTFTLVDGKKLEWTANSLEACPITSDVATLFVTKAGAGDVLLEILTGYDVTP